MVLISQYFTTMARKRVDPSTEHDCRNTPYSHITQYVPSKFSMHNIAVFFVVSIVILFIYFSLLIVVLLFGFFAFAVQEMRQRHKSLGKQAEALLSGERLLMRQRFQFPQGWPQTSMVEAAYADFETILGRR